MAKLTEQQVATILADVKHGKKTIVLAKEHGVSWATIKEIVAGNIWKHVHRPIGKIEPVDG